MKQPFKEGCLGIWAFLLCNLVLFFIVEGFLLQCGWNWFITKLITAGPMNLAMGVGLAVAICAIVPTPASGLQIDLLLKKHVKSEEKISLYEHIAPSFLKYVASFLFMPAMKGLM